MAAPRPISHQDSIYSKSEHSTLFLQCRAYAFAHASILYPSPSRFIREFIDPSFANFHANSLWNIVKECAKDFIFALVASVLISVYVRYSIHDGCQVDKVGISSHASKLDHRAVPSEQLRYVRFEHDCSEETYFRRHFSMYVGVFAVLAGMVLKNCASLWSQYRSRIPVIGRFGPTAYASICSLSRILMRSKLLRVEGALPSLIGPDSIYLGVIVAMPLMVVVLELGLHPGELNLLDVMSVVRMFLGSLLTLIVTSSGVPFLFGGDGKLYVMVEAELSRDKALDRIFGNGTASTIGWVNRSELEHLWTYDKLRMAAEDDAFPPTNLEKRLLIELQQSWNPDKVPTTYKFDNLAMFLVQVYIPEGNIHVDLQQGTVTTESGDVVWTVDELRKGDNEGYGTLT